MLDHNLMNNDVSLKIIKFLGSLTIYIAPNDKFFVVKLFPLYSLKSYVF